MVDKGLGRFLSRVMLHILYVSAFKWSGDTFVSLLASGNFCQLLITFTNSFDPDQEEQNIGPDLDLNHFTLWQCSWKIFFQKNYFGNSQQTLDDNKNM